MARAAAAPRASLQLQLQCQWSAKSKMPKYLAQDFLAEALQHRRSQLERMLIAPPHHIEFVDAYVHKGEVEDSLYTSPWLLEDFDADPVTHLPGGLYNELALEEGVRRDLDRLVGETASLRVGVESYQEGCSSADNTSDVGSDIDLLLSQDINSAIEKFASSSDTSGPLGGCMREEFLPENIHPWDVNITPECGQHLLEEPESPSHLALLSSTVPLAKDLARRVKLMMIQDPLTDSSGQLYTYTSVFKSDFILDVDSPERPTGTRAPPFEVFDHEATSIDNGEIDPVLELCVSSPSPPLSSEATGLLPLLPSPISSPEKELMDEELMKKQSNKDLKSLVQELNLSHLTVMELPNFSPSAREKPGMVDFTKLNDADVSHDSDDSGIGHALLESPCLPSTSPPLATTPIPKQLSTLDPLPLSPNDRLVLMNPSSERKFLKRIWDKDKVFDSVLALILPYPDIEETVEAQVVGSNVLEEARRLLNLQALKPDGDLELGLPWDPLAASYREMALAQRSLTQPWCAGDKEERRGKDESGSATLWREEFSADDLVKAFEEDDDDVLPTGILQRGRAGDHHPNLRAGHCPTTHTVNSLQHPSSSRTFGQPLSNGDRSTVRSSLPEGGGAKTSCFAARSRVTMARDNNSGASALDTFMMLRSVRVSAGGKKRAPEEDSTECCPLDTGPRDAPQEKGDLSETGTTSPVFSDVCLSGEYQSAVSKIEGFAAPVVRVLIPFGLNVPQSGARMGGLSLDAMKFFLKQQQKALEDNQGLEKAVELLRSCRLAACLYVLGSLAETLVHCSLTAGLGRFSSLYEKYENLIGAGLDVVKQELLQLQLASREGGLAHPKLHQLIRIVSGWMKEGRRNRREKAVVIVDREFPTLSGEILDFLQSLPGLKSCVFSFGTDGSLNPLYLEAVEERFHHYDCLVVPMDSIADNFPWEKISLLVEYEPLSTSLFPEGSSVNSAIRLKQYVILRTAREPSAASLADSGLQEGSLSSVQYTFIASENITVNTQLLQLLETRYNMLIIERDYSELRKESRKTNRVSYADLIVDQSSGIVLRPLSLLSSDVGLRTLVNLATALSLQYEKCWIILFAQADNSYPFGGCVPTNLARLHASLAHYCPKRDYYDVKVLCVPSTEEAAQMIRRVSEETHKHCKVWSYKDWIDRSWLAEDLSKAERFLLNFPCLNAFSAQVMLKKCPLGQLLSMELPQLQTTVPWLPEKALKFFCTMCHVTLGSGAPFTASTSEWSNAGDKYCSVDFQSMQDSETFDNHFPLHTSNDSVPLQIEAGQDGGLGYMMPGAGYTEVPVISGTESDVVVMSSGDERELLPGEHREFSIVFGEAAAISGPSVLEDKNAWDGPLYGSNYDQASSHFPPNPPASPAPLDFSLLGGNDEGSFDPSFTSSSFQLSPTHDQTRSMSNLLDFPQSNSPPSYASPYSWNQPGAADNPNIASFDLYQPLPPAAVKLPVFSASSRTGKTPSQKQIKNAVMSKLSSSFHPSGENTTRLAKEYYSGLVSSRFLASAAARHTNTPSRNPVKSLDLGFEDLCDRVQNPQFQSNDRSIAVTGCTNGRALSNSSDVDWKSRSVSNWRSRDSLMSDRPQRLLDLKAFHSREMQQVAQGSGWNVRGKTSTHPSRHVDNWLNLPCLISSKATRQKRPCSEVSLSDSWVPSDSVSPEGVESSFFGSPMAGSVPLSPTRSKKRRLVCEKIPGSADGQTRLTFS